MPIDAVRGPDFTLADVSRRLSSPRLVGRAHEMEALVAAIDRARAGRASTFLVGGEAGIGKTRLVSELATLARARGALVLEGGCVGLGEEDGLPFAPLVEAFRQLVRASTPHDLAALAGPATDELGQLVPGLGTRDRPPGTIVTRPEWIQTRIFEGVLALLRLLGERSPIVLVIEDLHWADTSTRDLLTFLARNVRSERLVLVLTFRTDEVTRRHPLRPWLAEMERNPRVERLDLARLDRRKVRDLVEGILDTPPSPALLRSIVKRAAGNPFFAEELLAAGAADRDASLPDSLREVLLARIASLSDEAQRLLGVAAVAGASVEHGLLEEVGGGAAAVEAGIREALAAGLLLADRSADGRDGYAFRHALLAEAVYDELLPSERRRLHAAYAAALAARPTPPGAEGAAHLTALAHHASAAHESTRALDAWIRAGDLALSSYAFGAAARAYERAIDLWDVVPADDRPAGHDLVSLHDSASVACAVSGRPARAVELSRVAARLVDFATDPRRAAGVHEHLARASWVAGDSLSSFQTLETAVAALERTEPTPEYARVLASLAAAHMLTGRPDQAIPLAHAAIDMARRVGDAEPEAHALNTLGVSLCSRGECDEGLALTRASMAMATELGGVHDLGRAYANLSEVLSLAGRPAEGYAVAREGIEWSARVGTRRTYGLFIQANAAEAAIDLGRWDEALGLLDDALATDGAVISRLSALSNMATLLARRGDRERARTTIDEGTALLARLRDAQITGPLAIAAIELALLEGRHADAVEAGERARERVGPATDTDKVTELLEAIVRAHAEAAVRHRAARHARDADEHAAAADRHATELAALVAQVPGESALRPRLDVLPAIAAAEVARAAGEPSTDRWRGALATVGPTAYRPWHEAYARYRLAEALVDEAGDLPEAARLAAEAARRAEELGALPLLADIRALARRARLDVATGEPGAPEATETAPPANPPPLDAYGLTAREREVLALLAGGLTNRRIADALFISESTAGVHVSNILGKLGVTSRVQAATVAARLGLEAASPEPDADRVAAVSPTR